MSVYFNTKCFGYVHPWPLLCLHAVHIPNILKHFRQPFCFSTMGRNLWVNVLKYTKENEGSHAQIVPRISPCQMRSDAMCKACYIGSIEVPIAAHPRPYIHSFSHWLWKMLIPSNLSPSWWKIKMVAITCYKDMGTFFVQNLLFKNLWHIHKLSEP